MASVLTIPRQLAPTVGPAAALAGINSGRDPLHHHSGLQHLCQQHGCHLSRFNEPRQLAPNVLPPAALAGVVIRTGSVIGSGERVVSGLVQRLGSLSFVNDNAGCFGSRPIPAGGSVINFGKHQVYVATVPVCGYPGKVLVAADPPAFRVARGRRIARPASCVEVMMTGPGAGSDAEKGYVPEYVPEYVPDARRTRQARPPLERPVNLTGHVGTFDAPTRANPLRVSLDRLAVPVVPSTDLALAQAHLEEQRQAILEQAIELERARREFDISHREYSVAHGFSSVESWPSRVGSVRQRGRNLNAKTARDGRSRSRSGVSASRMPAEKPRYSTPVENLSAAKAAAAGESSMSSGRGRQLMIHDPAYAAERNAGIANVGNNYASHGKGHDGCGQPAQPAQGMSAGGGLPPRHAALEPCRHQSYVGQGFNHPDDDPRQNSHQGSWPPAMEDAGYQWPEHQVYEETDGEYLARGSTLCNPCEGVTEAQAIFWFAQGCRHGSMLWQRLQRDKPTTLAEAIKIADSYALGGPTQPSFMTVEPSRLNQGNDGSGSLRQNDCPNFRNKKGDDRTGFRINSSQVAAVDQDQPKAKKQFRMQGDGKKPSYHKQKFNYEAMLDQPCKFHTADPSMPANHSTRQCSWSRRMSKGRDLLPPPPPLTGANVQTLNAQPRQANNQGKKEAAPQGEDQEEAN